MKLHPIYIMSLTRKNNMPKEKKNLKPHVLEREILDKAQKELGKNLVSLLVEGSRATYDFIEGYSDYDLLALVKDTKKAREVDFNSISKKYKIEIQCVIKKYSDLINRIKNNNKATRYINNLLLIKYKKQARILAGRNIVKLIPSVKELIKRDLGSELQANYLYATNPNKTWNIFSRQPRKWTNYMINMSNDLLLSRGIAVKKEKIPQLLKKYFPKFKGLKYVQESLDLRVSKKVLNLTKSEKNQLKNNLNQFLVMYKELVF